MQYKSVTGVLNYNNETRNELLNRKGGRYFLYEGAFKFPVGTAVDFKEREVKSLTGEKAINVFTDDGESDYSKSIINQYFNGIKDVITFSVSGFSNGDFVRWHGKRDEYIALSVSNEGVLNTDLGASVVFYHYGYDGGQTCDKQILGEKIYDSLSSFYSNKDYYVSHNRTTDGKSINIATGKFDGFDDKYALSYQAEIEKRGYYGKRVYNVWGEGDNIREVGYANSDESNGQNWVINDNGLNEFSSYTHVMGGKNNLVKKTDELYNNHKIKTIFSRFKTSNDDGYNNYVDEIDSAKVVGIGNPHGRGLLKLGVNAIEGQFIDRTNGYENPYCRSWTYHHQFHKVKDLIRPLPETDDEGVVRDGYSINIKYRSRIHGLDSGDKYLKDNTVLQSNGFVRITPSVSELVGNVDKDRLGEGQYAFTSESAYNKYMGLKKYMFSIENLAWADGTSNNLRNLSMEQLGPNNGRIMWFPPYNLDFRESVNVKWNQHEFIGRGENIYTYSNTARKGTLSFSLLIDHPTVVNSASDGIYAGAEPDEDPEGDILRFFAGCQLLDPDIGIDPNVPESIRKKHQEEQRKAKPIVSNPTGQTSFPQETTGTDNDPIIFYVFFPNNYSGMWNDGKNLVKKEQNSMPEEYRNDAPIDKNWYMYLMTGRGTQENPFSVDKEGNFTTEKDILGYEMTKGSGLSKGIEEKDKIVANKTPADEQADYFTYMNSNKSIHGTNKFEYLVDYDLRQGGLGVSGYTDPNSYGLNSDLASLKNEPNTSDANYTFSEVFTVLYYSEILNNEKGKSIDTIKSHYETMKDKIASLSSNKEESLSRMGMLESIFRPGDNEQTIYESVVVKGGATAQDTNNSQTLAERRAYTVKKTLDGFLDCDATVSDTIVPDDLKGSDNNITISAKIERFAKVVIKTKKVSISKAGQDSDRVVSGSNDNDNNSGGSTSSGSSSGYGDNNENDNNEPVYSTIATYDEDELAAMDSARRRYDDEYRFFRRLKEDSPLIYKRLTDKFKYFNPAFHSLSPEGFNARLTFLHQCTRQGHTNSASESNGNFDLKYGATSGNLAFGKMPVCVLRIGDFINTKIVIESMSIDYKNGEQIQWDLNQEGAGVQPMYANVSMNIAILGGQSLDGPINRLQNAVTFNYYANAPVYDDRADRVINNNDGTLTYTNLYVPFTNDDE